MWVFFSLAAAISAALVVVLSKAGIQKLAATLVFGIESICVVIVTWAVVLSRHLQIAEIDRKIWFFILGAGVLTAASSHFSFHSLQIGRASRTPRSKRFLL